MLALSCRRTVSPLANIIRQIHLGRSIAVEYRPPIAALQQQAINLGREEIRESYERIACTTRPISPHLFIYKMESHMFMSFMHRVTGGAMWVLLPCWGGLSIVWPNWYNWGLGVMATWKFGYWFASFMKFAFSYPFLLHAGNGVRHFIQDFGYGLGKHQLPYLHGAVFCITTAIGAFFTFYTFK